VSKNEILLQLIPAKVEDAVTQSQLFCGEFLTLAERDRNRRRIGRADDVECCASHLDLSGRDVRVDRATVSRDHFALDENDTLNAGRRRRADERCARPRRAEGELDDTFAIPKIDEQEAAEIAASLNPPAKTNALTNVFGPKCTAEVRAK
jgi:hypothetical protein